MESRNLYGWLMQLRRPAPDLRLRRGRPVEWPYHGWHLSAGRVDPEALALCALDPQVEQAQREWVVLQLLAGSRSGLATQVRATLDRVVARLLVALPADRVLTIFLTLKRERHNSKHATRAIVRYLLGHPALPALLLSRRRAVRECLEHALGRNVARGCTRHLRDRTGSAYVRRHLLRHVADWDRARMVWAALFPHDRALEVLAEARDGYARTHLAYALTPKVEAPRPRTVTATNRGDIAATLVHLYQGGDSPELRTALEHYVARRVATLPRCDVRLAVVLDLSASVQSYGEREFSCLAQAVALTRVLERVCRLQVHGSGGVGGNPPRPGGASDLAGGLVRALGERPDLVAVVTDGYENRYPGDLERVVSSLPAAGISTPVVLCHSTFTHKDDLRLRRPTQSVPELSFWHEDDFDALIPTLFAAAGGPGETFLRDQLRSELEEARPLWLKLD